MRLKEIDATNIAPITRFAVEGLSDVVVLAGPNGVGKTRLIQSVLQAFQSPSAKSVRLVVEATCPRERDGWGKLTLDTRIPRDAECLTKTLKQSKRRAN